MYYLNPENALNRLRNEWLEHNGLIIAVDFDSTLCPYKDYEKDDDAEDIRQLVKNLKGAGCTICIWTARGEERHQDAKDWLKANNIEWDCFNDSIEVGPNGYTSGRKIYANVYLDDRAGLWQVYHQLNTLLNEYEIRRLKINLNGKEQSKEQ